MTLRSWQPTHRRVDRGLIDKTPGRPRGAGSDRKRYHWRATTNAIGFRHIDGHRPHDKASRSQTILSMRAVKQHPHPVRMLLFQ